MKIYSVFYDKVATGWHVEANPNTSHETIFSQGETIQEARKNLLQAIRVLDGEQDVLLREAAQVLPHPECGAV